MTINGCLGLEWVTSNDALGVNVVEVVCVRIYVYVLVGDYTRVSKWWLYKG